MNEEPSRNRGRRSRRSVRSATSSFVSRELPFLLVLVGVGCGLAVVGLYHFRSGSVLIGVTLVLGGVVRLVLSGQRAGLLVVRGRILDAIIMIGLGVLITVTAAVVPPV